MKTFFKDNNLWIVLVICLLGLVPFLWLHTGQMVVGHDSGLPFNPIVHWQDRLYTWTLRYGMGMEQTFALGGFFIHGLEALLAALGFSITLGQQIAFSIYFILPGLSIYYLLTTISPDKKYRPGWLVAAVFYMFNHYLLQGWFVAERTKFTIYIAVPLILAILLKVIQKRLGVVMGAALVGLILMILNGGGFFPLYGYLFVAWGVTVIYFSLIERSWYLFGKMIIFSVLSGVFYGVLNAYWLFPYIYNALHTYGAAVESVGGISGVKSWVSVISENTSYINLIRLLGIQEWYVNAGHPYAGNFLKNPLLIFVSSMIPAIAIASLLIKSEIRKYLVWLAWIVIISMVFSAGSQPPFGSVYLFLVEFMPGFAIFRTPFYKFAGGIWLGYSVMLGYMSWWLINKINLRYWFSKGLLYLIIIVLIVGYNYPVLDGRFFDYVKNVQTTRVSYPDYVERLDGELSKDFAYGDKLLMLPEHSINLFVEAYDWKYWSLATVPSLATRHSLISNNQAIPDEQKKLLMVLYDLIKNNNSDWIKLANILSVKGFVVRGDFDWQLTNYQTTNPEIYDQILSNSSAVKLESVLGKWKIYRLVDQDSGRVRAVDNIVDLIGKPAEIGQIISFPEISSKSAVLISQPSQDFFNQYISIGTCLKCDLEWNYLSLPENDIFGIGSMFFKLAKYQDDSINYQLLDSDRRVKLYKEVFYRRFVGLRNLYILNQSDATKISGGTQFEYYIDQFDKLLDLPVKGDQIRYNLELIILVDELKQLAKELDILYNQTSRDSDVAILNSLINRVELLIEKLEVKVDPTQQLEQKKYNVLIPKTGGYRLRLDTKSLLNVASRDDTTEFKLVVNDNIYRLNRLVDQDSWYETELINLEEGVHQVTLIDPLINSALDFSAGPEVRAATTNDGILIKSAGNEQCYKFPLIADQTSTESEFLVEYYYQRIEGNQDFASFINRKGETKTSRDKKDVSHFSGANYPSRFREWKIIKPTEQAVLNICNVRIRNSDVETINKISRLKIIKMIDPYLVAVSQSSAGLESNGQLAIESNNNTEVDFYWNGKKTMVEMMENYSNNWQLINDQNQVVSEQNHFKPFGLFNGWIIDSGTYRLSYQPQESYRWGIRISLIGVLCALVIVLRKKIK